MDLPEHLCPPFATVRMVVLDTGSVLYCAGRQMDATTLEVVRGISPDATEVAIGEPTELSIEELEALFSSLS